MSDGIRVSIHDAGVMRHIAWMALRNTTSFNAILRDIGEDILGDVQDNIHKQRLVDGSPMPQSAAAKKRAGKTLLDKGHLRDSYTLDVGVGQVQVGSNWPYARIHHFGGMTGRGHKTRIEPRPILGASPRREELIAEKLLKDIDRGLR